PAPPGAPAAAGAPARAGVADTGGGLGTPLLIGKQVVAPRLARDRRQRAERVLAAADARGRAAIGVADQDPSGLVDRGIHEVEQVAALVRAAAHPDAAALH